jgi:hypothetical protein
MHHGWLNSILFSTLLLAAAFLGGCAGSDYVTLSGPAKWSSLGTTLSLPTGTWMIEEDSGGTGHTVFSLGKDNGSFVLLLSKPAKDELIWVTLQKLFVDFQHKEPLGQWRGKTAQDEDMFCIGFMVHEEDSSYPVAACAVIRDGIAYQIIGWGFAGGFDPSRKMVEQIIHTLEFSPAKER